MQRIVVFLFCAAAAVDQRVNTLLRQMTLEEKIGQLNQMFYKIFKDTVTPEGARLPKPAIRCFGTLSCAHRR